MQSPRGDCYPAHYYQPEFKELLFAQSSINSRITSLAIVVTLNRSSCAFDDCMKAIGQLDDLFRITQGVNPSNFPPNSGADP
jgi:hypothetical protein